jgi:hypothetical protein
MAPAVRWVYVAQALAQAASAKAVSPERKVGAGEAKRCTA